MKYVMLWLMVVVSSLSFMLGSSVVSSNFKKHAVVQGYAEYNLTSGAWQWKEKPDDLRVSQQVLVQLKTMVTKRMTWLEYQKKYEPNWHFMHKEQYDSFQEVMDMIHEVELGAVDKGPSYLETIKSILRKGDLNE